MKRTMRMGCGFKGLVWLWLFVPTLAFAPPERRPLTPEVLRALFLGVHPRLDGVTMLLEEAKSDPLLRKAINDLIRETPELAAEAEKGLAFRAQTRTELEATFPRSGELYDYATNPFGTALRSLRSLRSAVPIFTDRPLPPYLARQRALGETVTRYQLSPETREDELDKGSEAWLFFRRQLQRREQDMTLTKKRVEESQQEHVNYWKTYVQERIRDARIRNIRHALASSLQEFGPAVWTVYDREGGQEKRGGTITLKELPDLPITLMPSQELSALPSVQIRGRLTEALGREMGAIYRSTDALLRELLHLEEYAYAASNKAALQALKDSPERDHLVLELGGGLKANAGSVLRFLNQHLPVLEQGVWTVRNKPREYISPRLLEVLAREVELAELAHFLESDSPKGWRQLEARLADKNKSRSSLSPVDQTLFHRIARDPLHTPADPITGLEWQGYRTHPSYWEQREEYALKRNMPHLWGTAPVARGWGQWMRSTLRGTYQQVPRSIRPLILWSGVVVGTFAGTVVALGHGTSTFHAVADVFNDTQSVQKIPPPSTIPWEQVKRAMGSIHYRLEFPGPLTDAPKYFDVPHITDKDEFKVSPHTYNVPAEAQSSSELRVRSAGPQRLPDDRIIPIPVPAGYKLNDLQMVLHGQPVKPGGYAVEWDPLQRVLNVKMGAGSPAGYTFSAGFKKDSAAGDKDESLENLDQNRLEKTNTLAREAGFTDLADRIQARIDQARAGGAPVTMEAIAKDFQQSGIYTFIPPSEGADEGISPDNPFFTFSKFLRKGRLASQCNTANQFLAAYLKLGCETPRLNRVFNITTYHRNQDQSILTAGDYHLRTVFTSLDGSNRKELDGTPTELDIPPEESPFFRPPGTRPDEPPPAKRKGPARPPETPWFRRCEIKLQNSDEEARQPPGILGKSLEQLETLRQTLLKNPYLKAATQLSHQADLPSSRAFILSRELEEYARGNHSLDMVSKKVRTLYPHFKNTSIETPSDLRHALRAIAEYEKCLLDKLRERLHSRQTKRFEAFGNDLLSTPLKEFFDLMAERDWTPAHQRGGHSSCEGYADLNQ